MKYNKENLEELIINKQLSYLSIGKMFNVSGTAIKKAALKLGIILPKRRNINPKETFNKGIKRTKKRTCLNCSKEFNEYTQKYNKYCSIKCQHEYRHKEKYKLILNGDYSIMRANYSPIHFKEDIL